MAIAGRAPKSDTLRMLHGQGKRSAPAKTAGDAAPPPFTKVPPRPDWLTSPYAIAEWDKVVPFLVTHKFLNESNASTFALYCAALGKLIEGLQSKRKNAGFNLALLGQFRMLAVEFGLTPSSQIRAKTVLPGEDEGEGEGGNAFARNKRKAA